MEERISGGDAMDNISNGVVGWTIGKIDSKVVAQVREMLTDGTSTLRDVVRRAKLSERDAAGVVSYLLTQGAVGDKGVRKYWAKEVFNKAKVGEVNSGKQDMGYEDQKSVSLTEKGLEDGEAVTVEDILKYLRVYINMSCGGARVGTMNIALDELGKYFQRDEVGMVGPALMKIAGEPVAKRVYEVLERKGLLSTIEKGIGD